MTLLVSSSLSARSLAQPPAVDVYWVKVVTIEGKRFSGILNDIDPSNVYLGQDRSNWQTTNGRVSLNRIRKVALRRKKQTSALITGSIVGGLLGGYLASQSLRMRQSRSPVLHGLTLTFAAAGGAAGGLLLGSAVGKVTRKIIRPLNQPDPATFLLRQLEPFSVRYQQDFIYRLPKPLQ